MAQLTEPIGSTSHNLDSEEIRHLNQAHLDQAKGYGTAVLLVAGAALSLSMTMFTKMGASPNLHLIGVAWLKAAWIALGLAMLVQVFTVLASLHAIRGTLRTGEYNTTWGKATEVLNWVIGALLVLGLGGLLVFAFENVS